MGDVIDIETGKSKITGSTFPSTSKLLTAIDKLARDINVPTMLHDEFCYDVAMGIIVFACEQNPLRAAKRKSGAKRKGKKNKR